MFAQPGLLAVLNRPTEVDALLLDVYSTHVDKGSIASECQRAFLGRDTKIGDARRANQRRRFKAVMSGAQSVGPGDRTA
jgi:hypothetical protein